MMVDFFEKMQVDLFIRPVLKQKMQSGVEEQNWTAASVFLQAFIDSWPIAASIQQAWKRWNEGCDPIALSALIRANEIIELLGAPKEEIPLPKELPPYLSIPGEDLVQMRAEISSKLAKSELKAVLFSSPVPLDPQSQLALGEVRMEGVAQHSVEKYGLPALLAPDIPDWSEAFGRAPAGAMGDKLRRMCDLAILPGTPVRLKNGDSSPVGWLLWNGPAKPLPVAQVAVDLIRNIDAGFSSAFDAAGVDETRGMQILSELVDIGALDRC